ncbi:hypothetical protein, unlikely [Trypanosoma congolense IL3000]|nr:hypothetical protein, unlikely [Trypanosoma congolense IL3000]
MDCCFQWLHCLLARELPLSLVILLWERYMAMFNSETVYDFHAYVCAELLKSIRGNIIGQPVDVMLGLFKDPLEVRVARKHARSVEEGPYNDSWLRELIMRAFHFYQEHPPGDLSEC